MLYDFEEGNNALNFSQLLSPFSTDELPEGTECHIRGCLYAADLTSYRLVEGESCNVTNITADVDGVHTQSKY